MLQQPFTHDLECTISRHYNLATKSLYLFLSNRRATLSAMRHSLLLIFCRELQTRRVSVQGFTNRVIMSLLSRLAIGQQHHTSTTTPPF
ncbi:unnamed protein product [Cuscuta campestris]|uniref:Uncharacterized protein n=1 Tax=Cuscuta campestris TaxID=132261 RepID=A0A484MF03_9ASTE|nr:unnamed protein product [Cuscuta campestris]